MHFLTPHPTLNNRSGWKVLEPGFEEPAQPTYLATLVSPQRAA